MRLPVSEQALPSSVRQVSSVPDAVRFRSENFGRISELGKPEGSVSEGRIPSGLRKVRTTRLQASTLGSETSPENKRIRHLTIRHRAVDSSLSPVFSCFIDIITILYDSFNISKRCEIVPKITSAFIILFRSDLCIRILHIG